jgi:hypothetical protein
MPNDRTYQHVIRGTLQSVVLDADAPLHAVDEWIFQEARERRAAIALWVRFYNLCRVHETQRMTPAVALSVTDQIWSMWSLIQAAQEPEEAPPVTLPDTLGRRTPFSRT